MNAPDRQTILSYTLEAGEKLERLVAHARPLLPYLADELEKLARGTRLTLNALRELEAYVVELERDREDAARRVNDVAGAAEKRILELSTELERLRMGTAPAPAHVVLNLKGGK